MSKFQNRFLGLFLMFVGTTVCYFSQNSRVVAQTAPDTEIAEKVKQAFDPSRKYDYQWEDEIKPYGKKLIPFLEPYLNDPDGSVRRKVLNLVKDIKELEAVPLLIKSLYNSDLGILRLATFYLYDNFDHQTLARNAAVGDALRASAAQGNGSLSSIILLGYFPAPTTEKVLLSIPAKTSLNYWTNNRAIGFETEIPSTVPVYLSLYRIDRQKYAAPLTDLIKKAAPGEIEFLLFTLGYVDDPALLKLIFEKGIVNRKVLPSEYGIEGELLANSMRTNDLTVNQFARKLDLDLGFKIQETRYAPTKIVRARRKIAAKLATL